ncbi:hypothetical protein ACLMJK_008281 [Lecanora helva]
MDTMAAAQAFAAQPILSKDPSSGALSSVAATPEQIMQRYLSTRPELDQAQAVKATQNQVKQRYLTINAAPAQLSEPHLWSLVNNYFPRAGSDFQFWWRTTGIPFAILLQKSGYSMDAQCQHLLFYYCCVVPELGAGPNSQGLPKHWKSFMTDNYCPNELSWEWGTGAKAPTVRFSIEPIGPQAGTPADPLNKNATSRLVRQYEPLLADASSSLYDHFSNELLSYNYSARDLESEGHKSRTFVAFELGKEGVMLKAYFMPSFKSAELGQSNWKTITQAIERLPSYSPSAFAGLTTIQNYLNTSRQGPGIQAEIFAIDCIEAEKSRYKIYVRSRETNFNAVKDVMTLGGTVKDSQTEKGLNELEKLWRLTLELPEGFSNSDELPEIGHRTAGILYYFDIKQGSATPGVKVYIPVRHYAKNDLDAAENLASYCEGRGQGQDARKYVEALKGIATESALKNSLGVQTYIGCSVVGGKLKLISYVTPKVYNESS